MNFANAKIFNAVANAAPGSPFNSAPIAADTMVYFSVQAVFTDAAATGTLKIQMSNDVNDATNPAKPFTPTNWTDITGASVAVAGVAPVAILLTLVSYRWLRVVFTRTGGAGTFSASFKSSGG